MPLAVNEQSAEVEALAEQWPVLEALMGGTPAMRKAGQTYLPKWPNEEQAAYDARLDTATLFPAYRRTVGVMAGKPFAKALGLVDAPASIEQWAEDIDLQGVNLHSFAAESFAESFYGLAGILVEYPRTTPKAGRTVAQVEAQGLRPYWVRVKHNQILGWRSAIQNGRMMLTQLRLLETVDEEDGDYGVACVPQVRVLFPGGWQVWRQPGQGAVWTLYDQGTTTLNVVPFVPLYGRRKAFMVGEAPLLDLAYLNVKHWQSQSDQDTILHVARVPILAMIGAEDETQLTVGAASAVKLPMDADLKFVEHTGNAIKAGADSLLALEEQMIQTGAELMVKKPGDRSATESANDAEANKCDLQRMAEVFADSLNQALWLTAQYVRLPDAGKVKLFDDYGAATLSDASATLVKDLHMAGLLTKATTLREMQRRGVVSGDLDVDAEIELAAEEGPPLGTMTENDAIA